MHPIHPTQHSPMQIKSALFELIKTVITSAPDLDLDLDLDLNLNSGLNTESLGFTIERTKNPDHGDWACNAALIFSKRLKTPPRVLAEKIIHALLHSQAETIKTLGITKIELAGPGFINFYLTSAAQYAVIETVLIQKENYGRSALGQNKKIHIEYVSANPTGPLHVGHGRGAAFGSGLANLLSFAGFEVYREYYVNDAGRQMDILATSVFLRYLELCGATFSFPSNGYLGEYIKTIASTLFKQYQDQFNFPTAILFSDVPPDALFDSIGNLISGDKEKHIDGLIQNTKKQLKENYFIFHHKALTVVLEDIKDDLAQFGVTYQNWFSEKSLADSGEVAEQIEVLKNKNLTYTQNGALWFKATQFGDDKDRVLIRENGVTTYFASDVAYLLNKLVTRKFDLAIYVLGADHHGYIPRLKGLCQAFDLNPSHIHIPLVQFATLFRNGQPIQMSTRSGQFVTLRDLYTEVGIDPARYFYLMRKNEQHLDFDLDLAKSKSNENPVYYIQYAHARICAVFKQLKTKNYLFDLSHLQQGLKNLNLLDTPHESALIKKLSLFPELIENAAKAYEPHQVTYYLRELANDFHSYYNHAPFLVSDDITRNTKLCLISAVQVVLQNGLKLLGLSAPESM